jgi:hypothetical protein
MIGEHVVAGSMPADAPFDVGATPSVSIDHDGSYGAALVVHAMYLGARFTTDKELSFLVRGELHGRSPWRIITAPLFSLI